jgi:hypothetical protein
VSLNLSLLLCAPTYHPGITTNMLNHELVDSDHSTVVDYRCIECTHVIFTSCVTLLSLVTVCVLIRIFNENTPNDSLLFIHHGEDTIFTRWTAQLKMGHRWCGEEITQDIRLVVSCSIH